MPKRKTLQTSVPQKQVLAYDELESSVYQSEQMPSTHAKMMKRSSKRLRYVLFNANKYVCHGTTTFEPIFLKTCGKQCAQCCRFLCHKGADQSSVPAAKGKPPLHKSVLIITFHKVFLSSSLRYYNCHAIIKVRIYLKCLLAVH